MILAAGFGKRLYPLTQWMPKPLLPLTAKPVLYHLLEKLKRCGLSRVNLNTHHLPEKMDQFLANQGQAEFIRTFHEEAILNTGGGLKNAASSLREKPFFLVHNSDILSNLDLQRLMQVHEESGALVTLALRDDESGNLLVDKEGSVLDVRGLLGVPDGHDVRRSTYLGVAAYSRAFLDHLPEGASDLVDTWAGLMNRQPGSVQGLFFNEVFWSDLGTFDDFFASQRSMIDKEIPHLEPAAIALVEQGSSRRYYRLGESPDTLVLMLCEHEDIDFMRFIDTSVFLNSLQLGNPRIWAWSQDYYAALLEDLGDDTLYRLYHRTKKDSQQQYLYTKVVRFLADFQNKTTRSMQRCQASCDRSLNYEQLRWETRYFCSEFLINHLNFPESTLAHLEREFHELAVEVASHPQVVIHRDFQSQNILIKENEVHIVDYQGMRLGSICYDFMSLVNDPYVELPFELKTELKHEFMRVLQVESGEGAPIVWERRFISAGLQRNMQALGAYAFLSGKKGKTQFRKFMRPGCHILMEGVRQWNQEPEQAFKFPQLERAVGKALERIEKGCT